MNLPAGRQVMSNREPSGFRGVLCYENIRDLETTNYYLLPANFTLQHASPISRLPPPVSRLPPPYSRLPTLLLLSFPTPAGNPFHPEPAESPGHQVRAGTDYGYYQPPVARYGYREWLH